MARSFGNDTNNAIDVSAPLFSGYPWTLAIWFYLNGTGDQIFAQGYTTLFGNENDVEVGLQGASGKAQAASTDSSSVLDVIVVGGVLATGAWHAIVFTGTNATSRTVYLDSSGTSASSSVNQARTATTDFSIGRFNNGLGLFFSPTDGRLAHCAVWNVVLTPGEVDAYCQGALPNTIRPSALVGWWPLDGLQSPEPDLSGFAHNGTISGTVTLASGPPVMQFTPRWSQADAFVVAGVKWEIFMRHSLLPMMLAANPSLTRRQAMAALGLA